MDIRISQHDGNTAKAFISNTDLKSLDISADGIAAKEKTNITRLYQMMTALRKTDPFHSFFIDDVAIYPNGISCLMTRGKDTERIDPFFRDLEKKTIADYRNDPLASYGTPAERNGQSNGMQQPSVSGWAYSRPIPVSRSLAVITENMKSMLACALILKNLTESSELVKQSGRYRLRVRFEKKVVQNTDMYVKTWLRLSEFGQPCVPGSGSQGQLMINKNAVEQLVSMI